MSVVQQLVKLFGSRSNKDIKRVLPWVAKINARVDVLHAYSDQSLREETPRLQDLITQRLLDIDQQIEQLQTQAQAAQDLAKKEPLFDQIDSLKQQRNQQLEDVLRELLVDAFAVVKETARRFAQQRHLVVETSDQDRLLAASKDYITIEGNQARWSNEWSVAGNRMIWNMVPYDVQLIGGIILHEGRIAEMATGEGKTLVATLPAYLNALSRQGVHIVTVNDYLARRDAEWNAPLFEFHGLTVDCIDWHEPHTEERKNAYAADITYGTNNEFGFDYLRDNMAHRAEELVQRAHHFAMVDEVDSVFIDEARTPLIISGPVDKQEEGLYVALKPKVQTLVEAQRALCAQLLQTAKKEIANNNLKAGGLALLRVHRGLPKYKPLIRYLSESGIQQILRKSENLHLQENQRLMPEADKVLHFTIDEKNHNIELGDKGIDLMTEGYSEGSTEESLFILPNLGEDIAALENNEALDSVQRMEQKAQLIQQYTDQSERIHVINQLLRAYTLYESNTDYVVVEGKVKIVDEQTGRMLDGRRYSDGLHQALEAKEGVKVEKSSQTYATITLQNYFRMYHKLSGMTGTAETEAGELWDIYKLEVTVIPTHKPIIRADENDRVYKTMREKFKAIIAEIQALREANRPVLVGTTSVEISELLSRMLKLQKIPHQVLNAKQHQKEADVVAQAGVEGTITIATNMAGRGTDIKLSAEAKAAGGLAIVGSERHESRRVDRQLRGRSGRQGDPGSSLFFVSLEDNLMRLFGSGRMAKWMDRLGLKEDELIQHSLITSSIERAQKKVEENNFGTRKRLLEYDNVMNAQREVIYKRRRHALLGKRLQADILNIFADLADTYTEQATLYTNQEDFVQEIQNQIGKKPALPTNTLTQNKQALSQQIEQELHRLYTEHQQYLYETTRPVLEYTLERKESVERIVVPVFNSKYRIGVVVPLLACVESKGALLMQEIEKTIALHVIDATWKEHLREMDNLKQAVQNVVYEQKDPLLVYKFEAFDLFKKLLQEIQSDTLAFLLNSEVPVPDNKVLHQAQDTQAQNPRLQNRLQNRLQDRLQEKKDTIPSATQTTIQAPPTPPAKQPVQSDKIAGRNDKVTVEYGDGTRKEHVKYKKVANDLEQNRCVLVEVHK